MRLIGLAVALALSLALAALAAEAQLAGGKVYRIGFLQAAPNTPALNYTETFRQGLRDHGYVEGQNIVIEHRVSRTPKDNPALLADRVPVAEQVLERCLFREALDKLVSGPGGGGVVGGGGEGGTTKKSIATISPICVSRKALHVEEGSGGACRMYLATVSCAAR